MSTQYQQSLKQVESLIGSMDLPTHRKSVKHNDDLRWLKLNLSVRNGKHKNFKKAIELIEQIFPK